MSQIPISLFETLARELAGQVQVIRCTKATLVHLSHTLEDIVLTRRIPALLFTGFQQSSYWQAETARYTELAGIVRQVTIFAGKPLPPDGDARWLAVELAQDDPLRQEWFLLILSDEFCALLCGHDNRVPAHEEAWRQFDTFWTFDPTPINRVLDVLETVIERYAPNRLPVLREARRSYHPKGINGDVVFRLYLDMIEFEENLHERLLSLDDDRRTIARQALTLLVERERLKTLGDFVRSASHDFRTPLSIIHAKLHLLERTQDAERRGEHLRELRQQTERLESLVEGLFNLAALDDKAKADFQYFSLDTLLERVITNAERTLSHRMLAVERRFDDRVPMLWGSATRLQDVFAGILDNAMRYAPPQSTIVIGARLNGGEVCVTIADSGPGIASEDLERIFEPMYRADDARGSQTGGLGLGLALARQVIGEHGGRIEAQNAPGEGAAFHVWLPVIRL